MPDLKSIKYIKKAELHCHSKSNLLSYAPFIYDSVQTIEQIVRQAVKMKISIIAVTDHDSLEGYRKILQYVQRSGLNILIVPGCEITTTRGHILAYGITKEIRRKMNPEMTIDQIHQQGGVAIAAHPYMVFGLKHKVKNFKFDAIEGLNSCVPDFLNKQAVLAAEAMNLPYIAGSDAHQRLALGSGCVFFRESVQSVEDVLTALRNGDFRTEFRRTKMMAAGIEHLRENARLMINGQ